MKRDFYPLFGTIINGVEYRVGYIVHYRWVYPWGSNTSCGMPIISYLERRDKDGK